MHHFYCRLELRALEQDDPPEADEVRSISSVHVPDIVPL
jgi:hypothetical protein